MAVTHRDAANLAEEFVALSEVDDGLVDLGDDDMEALEEQLGLLVVGEIADDDAAGRRVPAVGGRRAGQMGPDERPVFLLQAQFAALRGTGVDQTAAEAGIDGLVFRKDESGQRFVGQGFGRQVEQGGQGAVRGQDPVVLVEETVAGRGMFEQVIADGPGRGRFPDLRVGGEQPVGIFGHGHLRGLRDFLLPI